jgi:hypothetical protein
MKASELIQKLAEHIALHGDQPVIMFEDGGGCYEEVAEVGCCDSDELVVDNWKETVFILGT